jgi:hypothetical protein
LNGAASRRHITDTLFLWEKRGGVERQHPISNRLEPDSADGFAEGLAKYSGRPAGVLSGRYRSIPTTTAAEEELARLRTGAPDITVDRLTGLLRRA